jgi:ComF family protein
MAGAMARRLEAGDGDVILVPVPTTPERLRARGYNQAAELARNLSPLTGFPVVEALVRRGGGPSQVALHPSQRRSNVRDAFGERREARIRDRRVVLVDDVLTTGATALAAAGVLHRGGAAGISLLAFARTIPGPAGPS